VGSFADPNFPPPTFSVWEEVMHPWLGVATATAVGGPYTPEPLPIVCQQSSGGSIDPTVFVDTNNGNQPYCQFVVAPKVKKFEQKFAQKVKA